MIQFILSISLVVFFILEITLLRMLFAKQGEKMLREIVGFWQPTPNSSERNTQQDRTPALVKATNHLK